MDTGKRKMLAVSLALICSLTMPVLAYSARDNEKEDYLFKYIDGGSRKSRQVKLSKTDGKTQIKPDCVSLFFS